MRSIERSGSTAYPQQVRFVDDDGTEVTLQGDQDRAVEMASWFVHFKEATKHLTICALCMFPILPWEDFSERGLHRDCYADYQLDAHEAARQRERDRDEDIDLPIPEAPYREP